MTIEELKKEIIEEIIGNHKFSWDGEHLKFILREALNLYDEKTKQEKRNNG